MRKTSALPVIGIFLFLSATSFVSCNRSGLPSVTVYKSATCGCCKEWAGHLRASGFEVTAIDVQNLQQIKAEKGVPEQFSSCHTAVVDGYVIEGHVPAEDVLRLLKERPEVVGLTVPGMPIGSPGMEGPHPESYTVYTFKANGETSQFASHGP